MTTSRAGFTIIEVVVVLLIIAIATAVTVPALLAPAADDDALTTAVRDIDLLFRTARDSSARSGRAVTVMLDSATSHAWLYAGEDSPASDGVPLGLPNGVRLQLSKARAAFLFMPGGAAFADSLTLRAATTDRLVTIDPWTGRPVLH
jgi:prepilin-type N-terminal cleavage/methylation domain-containing protein